MIKESISFIANFLWRESLKNISLYLSNEDIKSFSSNDYFYLTTIYYMGKPNFSQLAEALKLTKPAISAIIRKLSGMGLILKVQSGSDKRMFYICITEKGKRIIDGDEELYKQIDNLIKKLTKTNENYEFIDNLLEELIKNLDSRN